MTGSITATADLPACPPTGRQAGGRLNDQAAGRTTFDELVGRNAAQPGTDSPGEPQARPDATPSPTFPPATETVPTMPAAAENGPPAAENAPAAADNGPAAAENAPAAADNEPPAAENEPAAAENGPAAPGSNESESPRVARGHHPHGAAIHGKASRQRVTRHGARPGAATDAARHLSVQAERAAALRANDAPTAPEAPTAPNETRNRPEAPEPEAADGIATAPVEADPLQAGSAPREQASLAGQPVTDAAERSQADGGAEAAEALARPHEAPPQPASARGLFRQPPVAEDLQAVARAAGHPVSPLDRPVPDPVPRRGVEEAARTAPDTVAAKPATPVQSAWRPLDFAHDPPDALAMRARLDQAIAATGAAVVAAAVPASGAEVALGPAAAPVPAPGPTENPPSSPPSGTPASMSAQVVRAVTMAWRDGVGEARVRLDPGTLGGLTVALRVERGVVTATMTTDLPAVRDVIHAHERELRAGLAVRGLDLGRLVVSTDPDGQRREPDAAPRPLLRWPRRQAGRQTFDLAE